MRPSENLDAIRISFNSILRNFQRLESLVVAAPQLIVEMSTILPLNLADCAADTPLVRRALPFNSLNLDLVHCQILF